MSLSSLLDDMGFSGDLERSHVPPPRITKDMIRAYFDAQFVETMKNPPVDLPEAAIDHFDVRDNINTVRRLYIAATNYLAEKRIT